MSRSSRGLGHRPFTAVTGVRLPYGTPYPKPTVISCLWVFLCLKFVFLKIVTQELVSDPMTPVAVVFVLVVLDRLLD